LPPNDGLTVAVFFFFGQFGHGDFSLREQAALRAFNVFLLESLQVLLEVLKEFTTIGWAAEYIAAYIQLRMSRQIIFWH
jgi:hypothetical protein